MRPLCLFDLMKPRASDHVLSPDELRKQAGVWLRLMVSANVTAIDAEAFKRWLNTSAEHKTAFNDVRQRWDAMKSATGEYVRMHPDAAMVPERASKERNAFGRRAFLGGAASVAAVAAVTVVYPLGGRWPLSGEWGADDRTAVGEQRTIALSRLTNVTLNTQTSIRHQMAGGQAVGINLLSGEAAIDLSAGRNPFSVIAGAGRSHAESGRFEVRYLNGRACVTCIEGTVRVEHPAGTRSLQAHQQTVYDASSVSGIASVDPDAVSAWRRGELVFNQARLSDVLAEIDRYRSGRVVLMNDAVRDNRVTGRFLIASLDVALSQLESTFDLNARSLPGGLLVLS